MNHFARLGIGYPAALSAAGGDLAVERHGPFGDDPRPARLDELQIGRIQTPGVGFQQSQFHVEAGGPQFGDTAALNLGEGVACGYHDAAHARGQHGLGAGGRLTVVTARFEGDVERGPGRAIAGHAQGLDLGMVRSELPVPALADDLGPAGNDAADHRIRLDGPFPSGGKLLGATHVPEIEVVRLHEVDGGQ